MIGRWVAGAALAASIAGCIQPLRLATNDAPTVLVRQELAAPNPALAGTLAVRSLYYGSGKDKRRAEYRDSVTYRTPVVDGTKLAGPPNKDQGKVRKKFWGFGFDSLPINGRVWYPDGPGPYPLVLIVHGNHQMDDYSDPGYEYLGRHLASRGFILASVDQNFLNGWMNSENDARGWMLLKHLEQWRRFNDSTDGPLRGKVDFGNIALMGHSRGGEAVAVAGAFNRLSHYPDDATVKFDFGFAIKGLVAIAPIDGQYEPSRRPTPLENLNYLVIHGSHDGDVSAFSGLRQYQRIAFTDGKPWFKSAIWMYRANHGQWNTGWGDKDSGRLSPRYLDLRGLIDPESQREFARVAITAFLDISLRDRREYLPLFRDHRVAAGWWPKTMYWTRFEESGFRPLARYTEDIDVTTGAISSVRIADDSLAVWRESKVPLRWRNNWQDFGAVWLGWNNRIAGDDTTKRGRPASYAITVPDSVRRAWQVRGTSALVFSLSPVDETPGPRKAAKDTTRTDSTAKATKPAKPAPKPKLPKAKPDSTPVDLSVVAVDGNGTAVTLPLSRYGAIRKPPELTVLRRKGADKRSFGALTELILQTYVIRLSDFAAADARFDPTTLREVRWLFDRTVAGTVVLSDVGLSDMDPAFFGGVR